MASLASWTHGPRTSPVPMNDLLFVYGTLHPDRAPAEIAHVVKQLQPAGAGKIRARRYELGRYPAIVLDENHVTQGHLFRVPAPLWDDLDGYEGFEQRRPDLSLFVRRRVTVHRDEAGPIEAWVYEYARPLPRRD